ncbi:MAG: hypothetical protein Q8Q04_03720 [archaeon]|nr:hypothetical protein [archaeon]
MKKADKKGSHISLVLSFIIFVVSLIFVYIIAGASINNDESKVGVLLSIEKNVKSELLDDIWVIRLNADESASCMKLTIPSEVLITGGKTAAIGDNGTVKSKVSGQNGKNLFVEGGGFVKVYYSTIFGNDVFGSDDCVNLIGDSWSKEEVIIESKINQLIANFSGNYSLLKEKIGIPSNMEFNLQFEYQNGSILGSPGPNLNTEVYLREIGIFYLSQNSKYENGKIIIKIW